MLNIKPVSELRNYNKILSEVTTDNPVVLTKNGYGKYAVVDLEEYEQLKTGDELLKSLKQAEKGKGYDLNDIINKLHS
ncbi:type II toxin-antitoxin system Phd/YefM family antitoxin [Paucilactobacillus nenjiangensis]|uniref:type II toxin-antitoxin system Phd/YefM family antitoxin n=1 Tax=Paucilactobacillus nenjiangensis TaxID=1296540 RepID=UPI0028D7D378|nr:type II toxin-antitoxin system Phd/YefM family antitoxin [Paucilactobacillus nenjiangensis]